MQKIFLWLDKTWTRLLLAFLVCGIGLSITLGLLLQEFEKNTYEYRKLELARMTEMALNTIRPIIEQRVQDTLTREQALTKIREEVRRMVFHDFEGYNYIFMSSYEGEILVQPFEPAMEGTNQLYLRDANGLPIIAMLIKKAQEGGGFVTYYYHPPGRQHPQQKISYVLPIPELGVYIGSGMYVEDIHISNFQLFSNLFTAGLGALAVILFVQYLIFHPLLTSYRMVIDAFGSLKEYFNPKLRLPVSSWHKGSEASKLLTGFNQLLADIEQKTEALRQNELKFRTLFECANDAIFILHNGIIIDCNYRTELLFARPRNKIIGTTPGEVSPVYQSDRQLSKEKAKNIVQNVFDGQPCVFEWRHLRGKNEFDAEVSLGRFEIQGRTYLLATVRDISERKQSEAQLQAVHEELLASYDELEEMNSGLKTKEEQIRHLAYHDALTGLPNRRYITELLSEILSKSEDKEIQGAVFFFDLDNFKMINDSCGHAAGDQVLIQFSRELTNVFGDKHSVARFGGDEFVVVLDGTTCQEEIEKYAERILKITRKYVTISGQRFRLSASIGIVLYPRDGMNVDEIFKNADTALYAVKNDGKNAWLYYNPVMQANIIQRVSFEQSLRDALFNDEFSLHYQPIVSAREGKVCGFEALLRWQSSNYGVVPPMTFIPIAEECGLIIPIGNWVLKNACQFALRLLEKGYKDFFVAVNISVKQLKHPDFVANVRELLAEAGLPASYLELEITETVLMDAIEDNVKKLLELKELGIKLALDDFGTGYSSLTYLKQLPIEVLKIDKSFVADLTDCEKTVGMIESIIQLSHRLGIQVVAEGVETSEQQLSLQGYDCDMTQGYLTCRPVPDSDVFVFLEKKSRPG
ncbi:EAL domain-containing protein [Sporomusa aerivorans]|uniref:EAL domain-containing protein n=1 Tax=Sporomusa aerivorans TaxID=204936 RepID=UPI003529F8E2